MDTLDESKILRLPEVCRLTGLSRSTVYVRISEGNFPTGLRLGSRARGWRAGDILAWLESLNPATSPGSR